jgi:mRNA interferase RelE/StbE
MPYTVVFATSALRDLERLPAQIVQRVLNAIRELGDNPRPSGCRKIVGSESTYRIRVGEYRVVYDVDDQRRLVLVTRIRHRKDVYR